MKTLTVVAVTSQKVEQHFRAIQRTLSLLPVWLKAKSVLITNPPWNIENFNRFMLEELSDYIHTDLALTVHWDGYAVHKQFWDDRFLDYDYIGAPWPTSTLKEFRADPNCEPNWVGNGGFSIRSKKWMNLVRELMPKFDGKNEDVFCCRIHPSHFLERGCKIAPFELAQKFSFELPTDNYTSPYKSFGFHGLAAMRMLGHPIT